MASGVPPDLVLPSEGQQDALVVSFTLSPGKRHEAQWPDLPLPTWGLQSTRLTII